MSHACPICRVSLRVVERYPRYVCAECASRASDETGRLLGFGNTHIGGGYAAWYRETQDEYTSHDCWIDGIACRADEARFGGIVSQALESKISTGEPG